MITPRSSAISGSVAELARGRRRTARGPGRAASVPPRASSARRPGTAQYGDERRGSGRSARGRRASNIAAEALDPPAVAAPLQRRPVVERVAPQLAEVGVARRAARRPRRRRGRARGARRGRRCRARRRSGCRRSAARRARPRSARSAPHSRSKRTWSATAPSPANASQSPIQYASRARNASLLGGASPARRDRRAARPGREGRRRLVRRAVLVGRAERQHLPPRLARRRRASRRTRTRRRPGARRAATSGAAGRRLDRGSFTDMRVTDGAREVDTRSAERVPAPTPRKPPPRIQIENPWPMIDCGRYPAKRVVGDVVEVSADIFRDGHEILRAVVALPRARATATGTRRRCAASTPHVDGDRWAGTFTVDGSGRWQYTIEALDRRLRHLARRARPQGRGAARRTCSPSCSRASLLLEARRARQGRRATGALIEHALEQLATTTSRRTRSTPSRSTPSSPAPSSATPTARTSRTLDAAARARSSTASARASAPGTSCSRARGAASRASRSSSRGSPSSASTSSTCRRSTRSATRTARAATTRCSRRPGRPRHPVGDRRRDRRPRRDPPRARHARGLRRADRDGAPSSASTSRSTSRSSARPTTRGSTEHPEWFNRRPDGTLKYAENPPKRYQDIYNVNWDTEDWRGLWDALLDVVAALGRPRREGLPRRQPAHQAAAVLGVADRARSRRPTPT